MSKELLKGSYHLVVGNILTLFAIAVAYFGYSVFLVPEELGIIATGIAASKISRILIDSGMRMSLINLKYASTSQYQEAFLGASLIALLLLFLLFLLLFDSNGRYDYVVYYTAPALLSAPLLLVVIAHLERNFRYKHVTIIESSGSIVEYVIPLFLWVTMDSNIIVFIYSAILANIIRVVLALNFSNNALTGDYSFDFFKNHVNRSAVFIRKSFTLQVGAFSSQIRDNLHLFLIIPLFGYSWGGLYSWAFMVLAASSQVISQSFNRVTLAVAKNLDMLQVADIVQKQITISAIIAGPTLVLLPTALSFLDGIIFDLKWSEAIFLVEILTFRMFISLAINAISSIYLISHGSFLYSKMQTKWLFIDVFFALFAIYFFSEIGLAIGISTSVIFSMYLWYKLYDRLILKIALKALFARPSLYISIALILVVQPYLMANVCTDGLFCIPASLSLIFVVSVAIDLYFSFWKIKK